MDLQLKKRGKRLARFPNEAKDYFFLFGACVSTLAEIALICVFVSDPGFFNPLLAIVATFLEVFSFAMVFSFLGVEKTGLDEKTG